MTTITLDIPGHPTPKGRARHRRVEPKDGKPFDMAYTPEKTRIAEENFAGRMLALYRERYGVYPVPLAGPLTIQIRCYFPVPKSYTGAKRRLAESNTVPPTGKPDGDNLEKLIFDAMKGVFYFDDAQFVDQAISKRYGDRPHTVVTLATFVPEEEW